MVNLDLERKFRVIWVSQSDGTTTWRPPKSSEPEPNAPPKVKSLNSQRGEMGYEEVEFNDKKHKEWRKKLGTLLIQDIIDKKKADGEDVEDLESTRYILGALPEGYKLYEGSRHEGTKLRKEIFVYGHPQGPKKRYRAAREFVPHLLWLSDDKTMDPRNCECKFCAPQDAQKAYEEMISWQIKKFGIKPSEETRSLPITNQKPATRRDSSNGQGRPQGVQQLAQARQSTNSLSRPNPSVSQSTTELFQAQQPSKEAAFKQYQPPRQNSNTAMVPQQPAVAPNQKPTPPGQPLNPEQKVDAQPHKFMFRQGETVWFIRGEGGSFGLAVVISRQLRSGNNGEQPNYMVQPLSHPFNHPSPEEVYDEMSLKPWLAYSPPTPFHEPLQKIQEPFHRIPWKEISEGRWGHGDAEADGSIFAARTVDGTYTTFEPLSRTAQEKSYNGVFFGGEKIWRGEAVRLAGGNREGNILIVTDILEVTPIPTQPTELIFVGDVYVWKRLRPEDRSPPPNSFLPTLVNLDLEFRNKASRNARKETGIWHFVESRARFSWTDVRGRWYPSQRLIPSLCGEEDFGAQIEAGEVVDAETKINSQGDYATVERSNDSDAKIIIKKDIRAAAFGASIPTAGSDFGLTPASYTNILAVRSGNAKSAQTNSQLPPGYSQQRSAQQAFAHLDPQQRAQLEAQKQQRIRMIAQAQAQAQAQQRHAQQQQQQQQQSFVQGINGQDQDRMDVDFGEFLS